MASLLPEGRQSFTKGDGSPLVGGKLYTYDAGTNNPRPTYSDAAATTPNTNPVILDARGEATVFWAGAYKVVLKDASDVTIWTVDNVSGADVAVTALSADLASTSDASKSDALIGVKRTLPGALATTQHAVNEARVVLVVPDFAVPVDGVTDASTAVGAVIAGAGKRAVEWSPGVVLTDPKAITTGQHWTGQGWTADAVSGSRPGLSLLKRSNGTLLAMTGDYSSLRSLHLDGNKAAAKTGDGVQVAATRQIVEDVSVVNTAGVGIRVGGTGASGVFNANLWQLRRPISRFTDGDALYVHHSGGTVTPQFPNGTPDCNAGVLLGGDFGMGGGIGVHLQNTIDSLYLAPVVQKMAGKGYVLESDAKSNILIKPYGEANNSGVAGGTGPGGYGDEGDILSGAEANFVFGPRLTGLLSGSGWADRTTRGKNVILAYDYQISGGAWAWRSQFDLWNRLDDGVSTTTDLNCWVGTNPTQAYKIKGGTSGSSGGTWALQTKIDGGALADAITVDAKQRAGFVATTKKRAAIPYSASITIDAPAQSYAEITVTNGVGFTINAPTNPLLDQELWVVLINTSGGAISPTWNAVFKLVGTAPPGTGFQVAILFQYDGTNWRERTRSNSVPN